MVPSESLLADNVIHFHKLQHLLVCVSHSLNVRYPMWTKEKKVSLLHLDIQFLSEIDIITNQLLITGMIDLGLG